MQNAELRFVFVHARDRRAAVAVWLLCPPASGDQDNADCVAVSELQRAETSDLHPHPTVVMIVDAGMPPPNAAWRKRLAESSRVAPPGALFAFVTPSAVSRGVYTALNWLRPPPYVHAAFDTVGLAERWIEGVRGPVPELRRLVAEVRSAAAVRAAKRSA